MSRGFQTHSPSDNPLVLPLAYICSRSRHTAHSLELLLHVVILQKSKKGNFKPNSVNISSNGALTAFSSTCSLLPPLSATRCASQLLFCFETNYKSEDAIEKEGANQGHGAPFRSIFHARASRKIGD